MSGTDLMGPALKDTPWTFEAYIRAIQPRPPGNVHAGQTLTFHGRPKVGAVLTARFTVVKKEMKKERRWLTLGVEMFEGDDKLLSGEILSIWAA